MKCEDQNNKTGPRMQFLITLVNIMKIYEDERRAITIVNLVAF